MNKNELLLAISDLMDEKIDTINVRMDTMENKLTSRMDLLDAKIDAVESSLSTKIDAVENSLSARIDAVENSLSAKIVAVDERLSAEVRKTNVIIENRVLPRINHIEQCYLDASERYIIETGRINGLAMDVQVIKSVVQDHSEQLKKIS